jgi:hypothetical protein
MARAQPSADGKLSTASPAGSGIAVSFGAGPMQFEGRSVTMGVGALRVGLRRHVAVDAEVARWVDADAPGFQFDGTGVFEIGRHDVTSAGANLLFRAGMGRVTGFAGGGGGAHFVHERFERPVDPRTGVPAGEAVVTAFRIRPGLQGVGGVDVMVARRVQAFASLRAEIKPAMNLGMTGGVRVVIREGGAREGPAGTARITPAGSGQGQPVDVLRVDGRPLSGRLVSLSATEVVIASRGSDQRVSLGDVRRVRRQAHWARNLGIVSAAFFGGLATAYCAAAAEPRDCRCSRSKEGLPPARGSRSAR